jgi:hypothetical protein
MKAVVVNPGAESREALLEAARQCPTQAIVLSEYGTSVYP